MLVAGRHDDGELWSGRDRTPALVRSAQRRALIDPDVWQLVMKLHPAAIIVMGRENVESADETRHIVQSILNKRFLFESP